MKQSTAQINKPEIHQAIYITTSREIETTSETAELKQTLRNEYI